MLNVYTENKVLTFFFPLLFAITALTIHFLSSGVFDMGDGILHYQIARYSWVHPHLFIDHWGKPFFTLLSSPFAQFGYTGSVVFNILCASLTLWVIARIGMHLKLFFSSTAVIFAGFSPLFFSVSISGLTEPLFALVVSGSILLIVTGRFRLAAIVVSFLPFVRTEGFILLPLFGLLLLIRSQFVAILLLAVGTLIYSFIGGFILGDFLWVVHDNPYKGAKDIYGTGSIFHFISRNEMILGTSGVVLFITGTLFYIYIFFSKKDYSRFLPEEILLIYGCFLTYFIMHSIFWHWGLFGSLGLVRVIAGVSPLAALISVSTFRSIQLVKSKTRYMIVILVVAGCIINIIQTLNQSKIPFVIDNESKPLFAAVAFAKSRIKSNDLIYAHHPYGIHLLDRDPFDQTSIRNYWTLISDSAILKIGTYVLWDSHFAPECGLPLEKVQKIRGLKLLGVFRGDYEEVRDNGKKEWPEIRLYRKETL